MWAAVGKDPGFSPLSLLELLKRRGHHRPEEIDRLDLVAPFNLMVAKHRWLEALDDADAFIRSRPAAEYGCLYFSATSQRFVLPRPAAASSGVSVHFGSPGGVLAQATGRTFD